MWNTLWDAYFDQKGVVFISADYYILRRYVVHHYKVVIPMYGSILVLHDTKFHAYKLAGKGKRKKG